ncbi:MAG: hypothetical protein DMF19_01290 [Verrucomicrobia bacterium]|nr:MAG: hypothetical protein DMF19_01290 [Verrucomicrobiota bacterium]
MFCLRLSLVSFSAVLASTSYAAVEIELPPRAKLDAISAADMLRHVQVLASDDFEGRLPSTRGESLSVNYTTQQFKRIGLKPGNLDGTFTQKVPLTGIITHPRLRRSFTFSEAKIVLS